MLSSKNERFSRDRTACLAPASFFLHGKHGSTPRCDQPKRSHFPISRSSSFYHVWGGDAHTALRVLSNGYDIEYRKDNAAPINYLCCILFEGLLGGLLMQLGCSIAAGCVLATFTPRRITHTLTQFHMWPRFSLYILVASARRTGATTYGTVAADAFGPEVNSSSSSSSSALPCVINSKTYPGGYVLVLVTAALITTMPCLCRTSFRSGFSRRHSAHARPHLHGHRSLHGELWTAPQKRQSFRRKTRR